MRFFTTPQLPPSIPGGRLTLTTAVPVLTTAALAQGTVFYTPYQDNQVPIYNGSFFQMWSFAEISNVLANSAVGNAGPAVAANNSNYDFFVWNNANVLTLTRGPLWTSDTARGTGAGTSQLSLVNGIWTNTVAITNGPGAGLGTYVGTIRTNGTATADWQPGGSAAGGTAALINVWNAYNRVPVGAAVQDSTASWTYTTGTIRASNAGGTGSGLNNRISCVRGLDIEPMRCDFKEAFSTAAAAAGSAAILLGLDSTTAQAAVGSESGGTIVNILAAGQERVSVSASYNGLPGLGFHFLQALEVGDGSNVTTFLGAQNHHLTALLSA